MNHIWSAMDGRWEGMVIANGSAGGLTPAMVILRDCETCNIITPALRLL